MSLQSDLSINVSKLRADAVSESTTRMKERLLATLKDVPNWWEVGVEKYRQMRERGEGSLPAPILLDSGKMFSVPSREAGRNIPCRLMLPDQCPQLRGVFLHFHGGGWVFGTESSQDGLLKAIADDASLAVVSVGYRLAPENPYPKGPEDCFDAAEWLVDNAQAEFGASLTFMGGESSGSHLALLSAFRLLESRPLHALSGLVLNFGIYDLALLPMARNHHNTVILSGEIMTHFNRAFLPHLTPEQYRDPSISPFYKDLEGLNLPPALFNCGTDDCLLDDSVMMALRWQMAGGDAVLKLFPGAPHGFVLLRPDLIESVEQCLGTIREFLKAHLK